MRATSITQHDVKELLEPQTPPCLSLYLPTHRRHPERVQDPVRYKNLLKELEASLLPSYSDTETQALLAPFRELAEDKEFWSHLWEGLAVMGTTGLFRAFRLQEETAELAVTAHAVGVVAVDHRRRHDRTQVGRLVAALALGLAPPHVRGRFCPDLQQQLPDGVTMDAGQPAHRPDRQKPDHARTPRRRRQPLSDR